MESINAIGGSYATLLVSMVDKMLEPGRSTFLPTAVFSGVLCLIDGRAVAVRWFLHHDIARPSLSVFFSLRFRQ